MLTLEDIEDKIKVRIVLAKFNALLYRYDSITKNHIIEHIKEWIDLYKKQHIKNINNTNFYNYLSEMDFNNHVYFINICDYIQVTECIHFINFLKNILDDE